MTHKRTVKDNVVHITIELRLCEPQLKIVSHIGDKLRNVPSQLPSAPVLPPDTALCSAHSGYGICSLKADSPGTGSNPQAQSGSSGHSDQEQVSPRTALSCMDGADS